MLTSFVMLTGLDGGISFFFFFLVSRTMKYGKRRVLRNRIQGMEDGLAKIE